MRDLWLRRVEPRLASGRALWSALFAFCAATYAVTAHWSFPGLDTEAAAWPAWSLAHRGTLDLTGIAGLPHNAWFMQSHGHLLSNRTIGVELAGVPANVLFGWTGLSADGAAALTAVVMSAMAIATLALALRPLLGLRWSLAASVVVGFGTAMWTVSATELWTHTGDALWLSLVLLALSRRRYLLAGLAFAPAILTRPHLAVAGIVIAAWLAVMHRSVRPLLHLAVPVVLGVAGLAAINHAIYGHWSLVGGYGAVGYSVGASASVGSGGLLATLDGVGHTLLGALFSPRCGLLLYTPVVLVGALGLWRGFRTAPHWAQAAALGGGAYELAQCKINTFTGGSLFFGNRLIVESVVLAAPLLAHCTHTWVSGSRRRLTVVAALASASVAVYAIGAFLPTPSAGAAYIRPWDYWYLHFVVAQDGYRGWLTAAVAGLGALVAVVTVADSRRGEGPSSAARPGSSRHPVGWASEPVHPA